MKPSVLVLCVLLVVLAAGASGPATAQTTILASHDAYVQAGANATITPTWTAAGDALRVRMANLVDNRRKSYIKFDLSSHVGTVGSASLSIWLDRALNTNWNAVTNPGPVDTADFYKVADDSWSESTVTWNSAPALGAYLFTYAFRHRASADPDTMYTWDVTAYVKEEFAGDKQVTFALADTTFGHNTDLRIYSKETPGFEPFLTISSTTDVIAGSGSIPDRFELQQNYPNPFNPTTTIGFSIPSRGSKNAGTNAGAGSLTTLTVYDLLGRQVQTLVNEPLNPGTYSVALDASRLGSGTYFYTLTAGSFKETKRMTVMK